MLNIEYIGTPKTQTRNLSPMMKYELPSTFLFTYEMQCLRSLHISKEERHKIVMQTKI